MRKVIASVFVSLDGVMQAPGGPEEDPAGGFAFGGWVSALGRDLGERLIALFESPSPSARPALRHLSLLPHQDVRSPSDSRRHHRRHLVRGAARLARFGRSSRRRHREIAAEAAGRAEPSSQAAAPAPSLRGEPRRELTVLTPVVLGTGKKLSTRLVARQRSSSTSEPRPRASSSPAPYRPRGPHRSVADPRRRGAPRTWQDE